MPGFPLPLFPCPLPSFLSFLLPVSHPCFLRWFLFPSVHRFSPLFFFPVRLSFLPSVFPLPRLPPSSAIASLLPPSPFLGLFLCWFCPSPARRRQPWLGGARLYRHGWDDGYGGSLPLPHRRLSNAHPDGGPGGRLAKRRRLLPPTPAGRGLGGSARKEEGKGEVRGHRGGAGELAGVGQRAGSCFGGGVRGGARVVGGAGRCMRRVKGRG